MTGYGSFLIKELREIAATWRLYVLPVLLVFCAATSPVMALATQYLVNTVANLPITLPDPTYVDAYAQWTKNLGQLVLPVVIVSFSSLVNGERSSGTAVLALSKGLTPAAFIAAKATAAIALITSATILGVIVMAVTTRITFGVAPLPQLVAGTAAWLLLAILCVSAVTVFSCAIDSTSAAAGLGLATWIVLAGLSAWGPATRWSPAGLIAAPSSLAAGVDVAWLWPVLTGAIAAVALVAIAVVTLRHREL